MLLPSNKYNRIPVRRKWNLRKRAGNAVGIIDQHSVLRGVLRLAFGDNIGISMDRTQSTATRQQLWRVPMMHHLLVIKNIARSDNQID